MSGQATTRRQVRKVENGRLTYYLEAANATFWDNHWSGVLDRSAYAEAEAGHLAWFEEPFTRHLPSTGTILEAGCGIGQYVVALHRRGYNVVGVEWAERTVQRVREIFPGIPVRAGDVTALDVPDGTYTGYISLGVMEHRREGPEPFLHEAFRVLAPGGIAVISVPHFHPLRRMKSFLNGYTGEETGLGFYQYAFRRSEFAAFIKAAGFEILESRGYDGVKGVKDESAFVRSLLAHPRRNAKVRKVLSSRFIDRTLGHMVLFVCRKPHMKAPVPVAQPQLQLRAEEPLAQRMHLGVFLTRGMSLAAWDTVGMLHREMALYRRLAERGVKVTLVSYGGADDLRYAAQFPGIGICVNAGGADQATYERTVEHVHASALAQVDVFKSNQMNGADVAVRVARHFGKPVIARCGYLWSAFAGRESGSGSDTVRHARAIEDTAFSAADRIVVTTAAMAADVAGRLPEAADRIMVTPNYVDTDLFVPAPKHKKQWDLLFIGRLTAQKNLELLLDVVNALPVRLAVVGQGPLEGSYRSHPASTSGKVDWLGRIPSEDLPSYMHRSRVFVLPSLYEGHPKTLLEAMGAGMPVVGTNVPGIADVIRHEETGLLAAPETVALATVIVRVLSDDVLAQRLGEAARQFITETCSLDHVVEREIGLLSELVSARDLPANPPSGESAGWQEQLDRMDDNGCVQALGAYLAGRARSGQPEAGLRMLFGIEDRMYPVEGELAVRYGGGTHTKHRHMKYHDFFVDRIRSGEKVLDVGCGIGAVAYDVASRCGAAVTGIDLNEGNIAAARARYAHPAVTYVAGDALQLQTTGALDVIILSNVLEHIAGRPGFLRALVRMARPRRVLIRVPLFERDWRIPLRRELGVEYRLDPTHETEYTLESFAAEMHDADLRITHQEVRWGEVWAECEPEIVGERPRVSVVMSTCNNGAFLPLALESIAQQTFRDFEWIVVDDGSTDDTAAILSRYADPRLRVIVHSERRGLTKSLNEAIAACTGTYIARMDGDDVALPERFEKQVAFLDAHPSVGLLGTGFMYIDGTNAVQGVEGIFATDAEIRSRLLTHNCFGHGTVMMRRDQYQSAGGYDETFLYAQDYDLWLRLAERCEVANLPEYLYCWRKSGSSVTAAHAHEQDECAARAKDAAIGRGILPVPSDPRCVTVAQPAGVHP